jgi:hypothetical protein
MDEIIMGVFILLFCAIVVVFVKEIGDFAKKIIKIRGMKYFLPMLLLTSFILDLEPRVLLILEKIKDLLLALTTTFANHLPFQTGAVYGARLAILLVFSLVPAFATDLWIKRRPHGSYEYASFVCLAIWLIVAVLLTLGSWP